MFSTDELHIEISSKCTLKCPRCPRTELKPEQLNREISLAEFKRAFNLSVLNSVSRILFCGDVGDPIYATEFLEIVEYIKTTNTKVSIVTNGSYKSTDWWHTLGSLLDAQDYVTFSVDGWDQTSNNLYRVNCNFDSIVNGIKSLKYASNCRIKWSAIYFEFNEHEMQKIKDLAASLGVDEFQEVHSTKFDGRYQVDGVDPLKPSNAVGGNMYRKSNTSLGRPIPIVFNKYAKRHEWAKCLNWQKELFINVDGLVFPCPWFNSGYQTNDFVQKYKDRLNIKTRPLSEVLSDPLWGEFITRLEIFPLEVCQLKCRNDR